MTADVFLLLTRVVIVFSAALLIMLALRLPMRQLFGARIAYALWLLVPAAMIASLLPARLVIRETPPQAADAVPVTLADTAIAPAATAPAIQEAADIVTRLDASPFIIALWALGFAVSLILLFVEHRRFAATLACRADGVHIAKSDHVGPAVIGVVAPRIVVPADFDARYTPLERSLVLEHERTHIRAGDVQINALVAFLQCIMWFNPLAYIARAALRVDQELACDERVMERHGAARRAYAEAMLKTQLAARAVPLGCAWPALGAQPLKQRITALARPRIGASRRAIGAGVCLATAGIVGVAAWVAQPPRRAYAHEVENHSLFSAPGARLVQALMDGDTTQARTLIADGANVNHWTPGDGTPLIMATRLNDQAMARDLLAAGADVNQAARGEGNALIVASAQGRLDLVRLYVEAGADVDAIVFGDETPLINAARHGQVDVARYLLEHGADPNLSMRAPIVDGSELRSPMIMARRSRNAEMIALLRSAGARD